MQLFLLVVTSVMHFIKSCVSQILSCMNLNNHLPDVHVWHHITLGSKKILYCAFIDYSKAFDTVEHKALWLKIYKLGLNSKLVNVVKSMYGQIKSCVKYQGNISESFWYKSGLIQGEALSPFLFSLFVNDLEMELLNNTDRLYQLNMLHLCLFMYADDTVLFSESVSALQSMSDTLFLYTTKWKLTVNINKSKIMVFRKGGKVNLKRGGHTKKKN